MRSMILEDLIGLELCHESIFVSVMLLLVSSSSALGYFDVLREDLRMSCGLLSIGYIFFTDSFVGAFVVTGQEHAGVSSLLSNVHDVCDVY